MIEIYRQTFLTFIMLFIRCQFSSSQ